MVHLPADLRDDALEFLTVRHLATLTTLRPNGSPHVVPVGFTWDRDRSLARIITTSTSQKVRHAASGGPVALCQVDGPRWLTLEGRSRVSDDPDAVAEAVARYAVRYRQPRENSARVVIEVVVTRVLGSASLLVP